MTTYTNYASGPRGINLQTGGTHWLEPGESVDLEDKEVSGVLPDLGKASVGDMTGVKLADMTRPQLEATMRAEADFSGASDDDLRNAIQKARDAKAKGSGDADLSILDGNVVDLTAALASLDLDHLRALRVAEVAGKNRTGALAAIDAAIAAKQAS